MSLSVPRLAGRRVLIVGLGRSGVAAARLCAEQGAQVTVSDNRTADALGDALAGLPAGVQRELGGHTDATFLGAELIVLSPGVPQIGPLVAAQKAGIEISGELELASQFVAAPLVGITGTNGKSTTTTLIGELLATLNRPTFVGGNLGIPLAEAVGTPAAAADGFCVVEISSFQLETTRSFHPRAAVLLNITPDHLDRHPTLADYAAAKAKIFAAQTAADFAIVNVDDPMVDEIARSLVAQKLPLSTTRSLAHETAGGWVEPDALCVRLRGGSIENYPKNTPGLIGRHNQENALAALLTARALGVDVAAATVVLQRFRPLAHRMEQVALRGDVAYFDDSKGTNVGATCAALTGFPRPVVLIAGGKDKGGSYAPLAQALRGARGVVLIGEAADAMERTLRDVLPVVRAASLQVAVLRAAELARPGDAVVLSPACSSFDMFKNYEHRAEIFRAAVAALPGISPSGKAP